MARPPKAEKDRKSDELRIPLTAEQKALIVEATMLAGLDGAATWARPILLREASDLVASERKRKTRK